MKSGCLPYVRGPVLQCSVGRYAMRATCIRYVRSLNTPMFSAVVFPALFSIVRSQCTFNNRFWTTQLEKKTRLYCMHVVCVSFFRASNSNCGSRTEDVRGLIQANLLLYSIGANLHFEKTEKISPQISLPPMGELLSPHWLNNNWIMMSLYNEHELRKVLQIKARLEELICSHGRNI